MSRDQHYGYCIDNETVRVEMPREGSTVEFYEGQNQFRVPFMMYADFEAILEPIQSPNPDPNQPYTSEVNPKSNVLFPPGAALGGGCFPFPM